MTILLGGGIVFLLQMLPLMCVAPCCLTSHRRHLQKLHPNTEAASDFVACLVWSRSWLEQSSPSSEFFKRAFNQSLLWFLLSTKHAQEWEVAPHTEDPIKREMLHRHGDGLPAVPSPTDMWICMDEYECQAVGTPESVGVNVTQKASLVFFFKLRKPHHMSWPSREQHIPSHDENLEQRSFSKSTGRPYFPPQT